MSLIRQSCDNARKMRGSNVIALRKTALAFCLSSMAVAGVWGNSASAQAGLAEAYCQSHMPILQQVLSLRRDGVPIDIALGISDSARNTNVSL